MYKASKHCMACDKLIRQSNMPPKNELLNLILRYPFLQVGKKYGVSDNAVRKWCDKYDLPCTKEEIQNKRKELNVTEWNITKVNKITKKSPKRPVAKYSLNGDLIQKYDSLDDASDSVITEGRSKAKVKTIRGEIVRCCNQKSKSAFGYVWRFV